MKDQIGKPFYFRMREEGSDLFRVFDSPRDVVRIELEATSHNAIDAGKVLDRARADLRSFFDLLERELECGRTFAGAISYEAGRLLMPGERFSTAMLDRESTIPLITGAFFDSSRVMPPEAGNAEKRQPPGVVTGRRLVPGKAAHRSSVDSIREAIQRGEVYQANYTFGLEFTFRGDPDHLFIALHSAQPAAFTCELRDEDGDLRLLSTSPEMFFETRTHGGMAREIFCRPMKGTARRQGNPAEDEQLKAALRGSAKELAENAMIVDLIRNDLGRVCDFGTVTVTDPFRIEELPGLFQMTTGVRGTLRADVSSREIFEALFPCGSVTGAPKIAAVKALDGLEPNPRGFYTGAMGWMGKGECRWNVAIRTVVLTRNGSGCDEGDVWSGLLQTGSGITIDSDPRREFRECLDKLRFFHEALALPSDFYLYETILIRGGRFVLLEEHLSRLSVSVCFFRLPLAMGRLRRRLDVLKRRLDRFDFGRLRLHLRITRTGRIQFRLNPLPAFARCEAHERSVLSFSVAESRVSSRDVFFAHKTSVAREFFDGQRQAMADGPDEPQIDELVFLNEKGEVTEGTFTNLLCRLDGVWCTPRLESGLLPGIQRSRLLRSWPQIRETGLSVRDLVQAERIVLVNSVRGLSEAKIVIPVSRDP